MSLWQRLCKYNPQTEVGPVGMVVGIAVLLTVFGVIIAVAR